MDDLLKGLFSEFNRGRIEQWSEDTWRSFALGFLYKICHHGAEVAGDIVSDEVRVHRHRDIVLSKTKYDCDKPVHDLLIRFLGSFIDQGFVQWIIPNREEGIYRCFLKLFIGKSQITESWMRSLVTLLREEAALGDTAMDSIARSLSSLGVPVDGVDEFIQATLLALPGWAGMVWQLETNAEWTPQPAPPGSLVEYLAVRLLLDRAAFLYAAKEYLPASNLQTLLSGELSLKRTADAFGFHVRKLISQSIEQRAFVLFQAAQLMNWAPQELATLQPAQWQSLLREISSFRSLERRRIFHAAYERHYRIQALDAISQNPIPILRAPDVLPVFQLITCIDDREESLRRHLEEIETLAAEIQQLLLLVSLSLFAVHGFIPFLLSSSMARVRRR